MTVLLKNKPHSQCVSFITARVVLEARTSSVTLTIRGLNRVNLGPVVQSPIKIILG